MAQPTTGSEITRRALLGVGAAATTAGLVGCSGGKSDAKKAAGGKATLPDFREYTKAKPDLPAGNPLPEAGFLKLPGDLPTAVDERPGSGSDEVTAATSIQFAVPPGSDQNPWWAELNDKLGIDLQIQMTPSADWSSKLATMLADSKSLPDLVQISSTPHLPQVLDSLFQPLDDHLAGDAIADYPNLANIPSSAWQQTVYNGHLYGIPIPRGRMGTYTMIRPSIFAEHDIPADITGGWDQLLDACKQLSDAKKRQWAIADSATAQTILKPMNGVPNEWTEVDGKLVNARETDAYAQSVQDLATLWKAGVMHPDSFGSNAQGKQLFAAGRCPIMATGYLAYASMWRDNHSDSQYDQGLLTMSTRDGNGPAPTPLASGFYSMTVMKKQDKPERIKLMLRMLNYLAAPFGTEENFFITYGKEGREHKVGADGAPELTSTGTRNTVVPVIYLAAAPHVLYQPGYPEGVREQHKVMSKAEPQENAAFGLYSDSMANDGVQADKAFTSAVEDIATGRSPMSKLPDAVKAWKSAVGDAAREEYTKALADSDQTHPTASASR